MVLRLWKTIWGFLNYCTVTAGPHNSARSVPRGSETEVCAKTTAMFLLRAPHRNRVHGP